MIIKIKKALYLVIMILAINQQAQAYLGGSSTLRDPKAHNQTTRNSIKYVVHDVGGDQNIKEYADSYTGVVFAVTWTGFNHPDFSQLFGLYWDEYKNRQKDRPRKHRGPHAKVETPNLVVETNGHMRNVSGKAYVKSLIPTGVSINDLQ